MKGVTRRLTHVVWVVALSAPAYADEPSPPAPPPAESSPPATAPELDSKALEARIAELEKQLAALAKPTASPPAPSESPVKAATKASLTIGGYVEAFWQWNFNNPSNFITNYRGFDNRHNIFTIDNAAIDLLGTYGPVTTHFVYQIGNTPDTYYLSEPVWRAASGAGPSGPALWENIQQANIAYVAPLGRGLTLDTGVFLSPIGPEGIQIKDQWNWSRSDLFFGLPFYHTGARATYPVTDRLTLSAQLYNGWNSVVDSNIELSPAFVATYTIPNKLTYQALYFGGVERPAGAPEGAPWRHLFDTYAIVTVTPELSFIAHADAGFENNRFGTSGWIASAAYARYQLASWLYLAARGDYFHETIASNSSGSASPIFWGGSRWISEGTLTLDARPAETLSVRLEYRHDQAQAPLFFEGTVATDPSTGDFLPNAKHQDTITVGAVAWF